jgi:pyridoxal phosphate enzyme (YggS family)
MHDANFSLRSTRIPSLFLIMSTITQNLQAVHERISDAAQLVSRSPQAISLLAVSKTFGAEAVIEAVRAGQRAFGENYLQEALDKIAKVRIELPSEFIEWHFLGPIQSNKTRPIAENFDWVHTIDREKIAQRLSEQRPSDLPPLNVCIQINISGELSKSGVSLPEVEQLATAISKMPHLRLRGLMAIPESADTFEEQRKPFQQLRELKDHLCEKGFKLDTLSMGMSSDVTAAIAEGATIVRVGTAIFGNRVYAK